MSNSIKGNKRIEYCLLVLLFALMLGVSGCGSKMKHATALSADTTATAGPAAPATKADSVGQVVVLTESALTTLDPYRTAAVDPEDSIAAHLWDTLVWLNDDLEPEPRLAESWRLVNDLTWELTLRQGVTFHNGEPFNAQAVAFSLERTRQLEQSLETFASDVALQGVEITDDYTVRLRTAKPAVSMIYELSTVEILPPTYYAQTPLESLACNPVGSGPYRLMSWDAGGDVVLKANADYWQGAPAIQMLIFRAEPDVDKRLAALAEGGADLVTDLTPHKAQAADTEHIRMVAVESTRRLFVGLRCQDGTPLADKRVRQALNHAVDVQALIVEFHAGYGQRYGSWVNPPHANPDLPPWRYDPQKALDLLIEAGYPHGIEIAMDTSAGRFYQDQEIAEAIAARMAKAGIWVTVQPQEWSVYVQEKLIPRDTAPLFLLSLMSWGNGLEDTRNLAHSFPFNPTLWYNEEFETLLSEAEQTFDPTLRLNLLYKAQAIAYEEAPWIWLWRPFLFYGVSQDLDWWQPRADGLVYLYALASGTAED